jgi:Mrp family chromosome partitioning ATPase
MSRNFEFLQSLGREKEVFGSQAAQPVMEPELPEAPPSQAFEWKPPQLAMEDPQREEVGKLIQRVFLLPTDSSRVVVFAGTEGGNGSSWICARAAEILASKVTGSVCVVDANLRSPGLHHHFALSSTPGLSDSLTTSDPVQDFVVPLNRRNLCLLGCGTQAANGHSLLLNSDRMRARLAEVRTQFNYVLIDAPALSLGNDAIWMGRAADGLVLILKANSSRRESARKTIQDLEDAKVRVLGAVLNQRTYPIPEKIYNRL